MTQIASFANLSKLVFNDSKVAKSLKLNRTKATAIVVNVIGATQHDFLVDLMKSHRFSLIIDESTDISTIKSLVMVVRTYLYKNEELIVHDFNYHVIELVEADATTIYNAIVLKFQEDNIPYKNNMIGFGSDGANVMLGGVHSVSALFSKEIQNLFVMKCICHSMALCASYACKTLPYEVEWLCREIFNHFSNSPQRTLKFAELQSLMDLKPLKMLHPAATRWLSLEEVVKRVNERLEALKLYFNYHDLKLDAKQLEKVVKINAALNNPITTLTLAFLEYMLPKLNRLNLLFQSEDSKIYVLHDEELTLLADITKNFIKPEKFQSGNGFSIPLVPTSYCSLNQLYLGIKVEEVMDQLRSKNKLTKETEEKFRMVVLNYYVAVTQQIRSRINLDNAVLKNLSIINPQHIKSNDYISIYPLLKNFPNIASENLQEIDNEYRELTSMVQLPQDCGLSFWNKILKTKRGNDQYAFPFLRKVIPELMCLPHSSAAAERVFSSYNLNKTKTRNRLCTSTMIGILSSKDFIKLNKTDDGYDFEKAKHKFTNDMYKIAH
ncbi:uncharacterized protein LOC129738300 [Uranotaenia lowii]|uniref:uncharacterized protein LOC129738300 n=1 Tax=Uranotaenia lowii TaxID=190385 RepID=UPI0024784424|nr:uncharacterized protein LOC129738300 [Uranotaenia lowii]